MAKLNTTKDTTMTKTATKGWDYEVINGTRSRPAGYIGTYSTRKEAEEARFKLCRMGGYITRRSGK